MEDNHALKLFAAQVLSIEVLGGSASSRDQRYAYRGYSKRELLVDCCGVVVEVLGKDNYTLFTIDDGTSVVQCVLWRPKEMGASFVRDPERRNPFVGVETAVLSEVLQEQYQSLSEKIVLSNLVRVQGKAHSFKGQIQIKCSSVRKSLSPFFLPPRCRAALSLV